MGSSRSTNTMGEFLQRMLGDIAEAKTLPDADLQFLIDLETGILQKVRSQVDALQGQLQGGGGSQMGGQQGQGPSMQGGMPGAGAGPVPGMPMPSGGQMPDRVSGTRMEPNMPNPDELRRMLS